MYLQDFIIYRRGVIILFFVLKSVQAFLRVKYCFSFPQYILNSDFVAACDCHHTLQLELLFLATCRVRMTQDMQNGNGGCLNNTDQGNCSVYFTTSALHASDKVVLYEHTCSEKVIL